VVEDADDDADADADADAGKSQLLSSIHIAQAYFW